MAFILVRCLSAGELTIRFAMRSDDLGCDGGDGNVHGLGSRAVNPMMKPSMHAAGGVGPDVTSRVASTLPSPPRQVVALGEKLAEARSPTPALSADPLSDRPSRHRQPGSQAAETGLASS